MTLNFSTLPLTPNYPFSRPFWSSPALSCSLHQSCIQLTHYQSEPLSPLCPPTQGINLYQLSTLSKLDKSLGTLFALCFCPPFSVSPLFFSLCNFRADPIIRLLLHLCNSIHLMEPPTHTPSNFTSFTLLFVEFPPIFLFLHLSLYCFSYFLINYWGVFYYFMKCKLKLVLLFLSVYIYFSWSKCIFIVVVRETWQ